MNHDDLVQKAEHWLYNSLGCRVVLAEYDHAQPEVPDAIGFGFKGHGSVLIECKASRSDFLCDRRKDCRRYPATGMGRFRFYMSPKGVITNSEVPDGWGLLWAYPSMVRKIVYPVGGVSNWASEGFGFDDYAKMREREMLVSALRRVHLRGDLDKIYDPTTLPDR